MPSANIFWMRYSDNEDKRIEERKEKIYRTVPLQPRSDLLSWKHTVVFSPHPDDESLGCGGLIRLLRDLGQTVDIVFVTDGSMSHPKSTKYPAAARAAIRKKEATDACQILGVETNRIHFLDIPDGQVPSEWETRFTSVVFDIIQLVNPWRADTFLVPWRRDPHEDHRATWEVCRAAVNHLTTPVRWVEYPVWMWEANNAVDLPRPEEVISWAIDIEDKLGEKEAAIRAHLSQWKGVIDDDPDGFQLREEMIAHFLRPREIYFVPPDKRYRSVDEAYFDRIYANEADPWNFETSEYERKKYAATIAALPEARYRRAFEIGCSIGVLTELLAERCNYLLGVDTAEIPLLKASERLADRKGVHFEQMNVLDQFPTGTFDLIVLSEVGYYWSKGDLERAISRIQDALEPGGTLLLVHYTPYVPDYPLTGDEVHETFIRRLTGCHRVRENRADRYRLDVWKKEGARAPSA